MYLFVLHLNPLISFDFFYYDYYFLIVVNLFTNFIIEGGVIAIHLL